MVSFDFISGECIVGYFGEKGKIDDKDYSRQIKDYSGLRYGNITPTDIDGFIEYHNKKFVFIEYKKMDQNIPQRGQELAFQRLVDLINDSGKDAIYIVAEHD